MELPVVIVNFKNYSESTGQKAVELVKTCKEVVEEFGVSIAVCPQFTELREAVDFGIPVFAQHIDPIEKAGAYTGSVVAENLKALGVAGSLINHSEHRIPFEQIAKCIEILRSGGMVSVCCAATAEEVGKIAGLQPDFVAIEPPELIGSGISVSTAKPEIVLESVKAAGKVKVLCGAGITTGEDVRRALELGTVGVLLASGVVKAVNPKAVLEELAAAAKERV